MQQVVLDKHFMKSLLSLRSKAERPGETNSVLKLYSRDIFRVRVHIPLENGDNAQKILQVLNAACAVGATSGIVTTRIKAKWSSSDWPKQ